MNRRQSMPFAVLAAVLLGSAVHGQPPAPDAAGPRVLDVQGGQVRVVPVARGLVHPWSLAFLPNGDLLVVEVDGRLRMIRNGQLEPEPVWTSPTSGDGGDALKSVAVHPDFAANRRVYVAYPKRDGDRDTLAIARGRLEGRALADVEEIFVADAWETGGNLAGRLRFGPDAALYVTVGDRDRLCCIGEDDPSLRLKAQSLASDAGKTLRIDDGGGIPDDNPFVGRADANPQIFTYGHRNGYGLAFHPDTGELWQAEIGPMGGDEVNILAPGHNYGWPLVSTGRNYTGTLVSDEPWARPGMDNPRIHWVPSISPSSILFYTGELFPEWQGNLFVGALSTRSLQRIAFDQPSQAERREDMLTELGVRIRDIAQSPGGAIYLATERSFGGSSADGAVLRIEPVADAAGTGPYPAVMEADPRLATHTVYRPAALDAFGGTEHLGIVAWGNGGCADAGDSAAAFLTELASHGYLVVASGTIGGSARDTESAETPAADAPAAPPTRAEQLTEAIDWALAENTRVGGRYEGRLDPGAIALMGYSCGGLQALARALDARVATTVLLASGVLPPDGRRPGMEVGKEILGELHAPIAYINGGPSDIAYDNARDDFGRIRGVPVLFANIDVGHGGTFAEPNGGEFARVAAAWLRWQLDGDVRAGGLFVGDDCGLCRDARWTIDKRGID